MPRDDFVTYRCVFSAGGEAMVSHATSGRGGAWCHHLVDVAIMQHKVFSPDSEPDPALHRKKGRLDWRPCQLCQFRTFSCASAVYSRIVESLFPKEQVPARREYCGLLQVRYPSDRSGPHMPVGAMPRSRDGCSDNHAGAFPSIQRCASCWETKPGIWSRLPLGQATRTYHPEAELRRCVSNAGFEFSLSMTRNFHDDHPAGKAYTRSPLIQG
jgi:hypothetical protein